MHVLAHLPAFTLDGLRRVLDPEHFCAFSRSHSTICQSDKNYCALTDRAPNVPRENLFRIYNFTGLHRP
jgi:hypothetical protein